MKLSFLTHLVPFFSLMFTSCGGYASYSLDEFSADNYPKNSDVWVVVDTTATTAEFKGLSEAIQALAKSESGIELSFPNMKHIPEYAIYGAKYTTTSSMKSVDEIMAGEGSREVGFDALKSIDAPQATTIGDMAFYGCGNLSSINAPMLREVGSAAFYECSNLSSISFPELKCVGELSFAHCSTLESVELPRVAEIHNLAFHVCHSLKSIALATEGGEVLTAIGDTTDKCAFFNASTSNAELTIGVANEDLVNDDVVSVNNCNVQFKHINISHR